MDNYFEQLEPEIHEKPINWREIFEKILMNWKWFVLSVVIALIAGAIYGRMQNDVYELKSSVLIIDQTRSGQMNEMSILKQLDAVGIGSRSTSMINNEEQVIKSTLLMRRVVDRLELYTSYTHRNLLKTIELYTASPIYVGVDSLSLTQLKSTLSLEISPDNGKLIIDGSYAGADFKLEAPKLPAVLNTPAGVIYIQLRPGMSFPDENINVTISDPIKVAKWLATGALETEVAKMLDVIELTMHVSNVQKGQDILNTLAQIYNQDASEQNNMSAINTARFIESRLKLLTGELSDVEKDVENYKQANKLTDIEEDAKNYVTKTGLFDEQQIQVQMQQNLVKYVDEFVRTPANNSSLIPNLGLTDVGLVAIIQQYNELLMARERIADGSSDQNPALKTLNQQINSTRKAIQTSIASSRKGLQITNNDLTAQNSLMQSKIRDIPRQEREFIEIKRQQQVKESLYLFLLQKREEAALTMSISVPKARVLATPDEAYQIAPHSMIILLVFMIVGLFIRGLIIYIVSIINTNIRSRADVEKLTDIPVITELGHSENDSIFIDYKANASSNSELFRLLRTKLQFTLDHPTEKVILVTSTMSGEGKTFVSINLAVMLSLTEKKVLLMGMDLRKPQLAKHFGIKEKLGITSYLSGQEKDYNQLIYKPKEYPLVHVLASGVIPPNPTELIMRDRFDNMINELKKEYDYIIIDSAPVGAVSDTFLIDRVASLTLYICRAGYTDKRNIEFVNSIKKEKTLKKLFFVVNDVNLEVSRYSYHRKYGYGYGYGNRYGYGYGQKVNE